MSLYYYDHLKFGVYEGSLSKGQLVDTRQVGDAILLDSNSYYSLRFEDKPNKTFYLVRNKKRSGQYLIFEKKLSPYRFDNFAGYGRLLMTLKEHLEIKMPKHGIKAYMSLFPEQINNNTLKGA